MGTTSPPGKPPGMPAEQFSDKISLLTDLQREFSELDCVVDFEIEVADATELVEGVVDLTHRDRRFDGFNEVMREYPIEYGSVSSDMGERTGEGTQREAITRVVFNEEWER